jgi:hypothetical protein
MGLIDGDCRPVFLRDDDRVEALSRIERARGENGRCCCCWSATELSSAESGGGGGGHATEGIVTVASLAPPLLLLLQLLARKGDLGDLESRDSRGFRGSSGAAWGLVIPPSSSGGATSFSGGLGRGAGPDTDSARGRAGPDEEVCSDVSDVSIGSQARRWPTTSGGGSSSCGAANRNECDGSGRSSGGATVAGGLVVAGAAGVGATSGGQRGCRGPP